MTQMTPIKIPLDALEPLELFWFYKSDIDVDVRTSCISRGWCVMVYIALTSGKLTWLWKSSSLIGKSTINRPFSIAMLNSQRVTFDNNPHLAGLCFDDGVHRQDI